METRKKIMIDQAMVKKLLREGLKPYTINKRLNVPVTVIEDIRDGKDRPFFFPKIIRDREKFCACCGIRKKMPGARYLCYACFDGNSQIVGNEEYACNS